jgi:hypothetical protein
MRYLKKRVTIALASCQGQDQQFVAHPLGEGQSRKSLKRSVSP